MRVKRSFDFQKVIFCFVLIRRIPCLLNMESLHNFKPTGNTCLFAIKKTTPLGRLKKSFCSKFNLYVSSDTNKVFSHSFIHERIQPLTLAQVNGIVFSFGCRTVQDADTCDTLKIRDKDTIWAHHSIEFHCPPPPAGARYTSNSSWKCITNCISVELWLWT